LETFPFKLVKRYYENIFEESKFFIDAELHKWTLHYLDIEETREILSDSIEKDEFDFFILLDSIEEAIEEEMHEGYVLMLQAEADANLTLRDLEMKIDQALTPIKEAISIKACFATLVL
jgi:hypothetical protein